MDSLESLRSQYSEKEKFTSEFLRYISFWPYILIFLVFCLFSANIFLRYSDTIYESFSTVEVIDKAQDSEMSLPTAMTVFNRSMINLDNEIGLLTSFDIHRRVATKLQSNVKYFLTGDLVSQEVYSKDGHQDFTLNFLID